MSEEYFKAPVIIGQTPGECIVELEQRLATAEGLAQRLAEALEADYRLSHLRQFPHVKPTALEAEKLIALNDYRAAAFMLGVIVGCLIAYAADLDRA